MKTKIGAFQLRRLIPREEFDYYALSAALQDYSDVRRRITELLKSGVIVRVKKGLYVFGPDYSQSPICKETLANLIYGPSCISLEYALSYHGLIPERVETITSVTPSRDKHFDTPLGEFTYRYLGSDKYPHGIEQIWVDKQHPVLMASSEKALCDYLYLHKIPVLESADHAREFLESDLRIEEANFSLFKQEELRALNTHYHLRNVDLILELL